jgi:hypothetical protein
MEHSEWILRNEDGTPVNFKMGRYLYVLDPTYPGVLEFFEELYRKLTNDYGFTYHKLDFMRSVYQDKS